MDIENRRSETRFPTDGMADVRIARFGRADEIEGRVCDISKSGLRIQVGRQILDGAEVTVTFGEVLISAEARHCSKTGSQLYEVGLKIIDVRAVSKFNVWRSRGFGLGRMPHAAASPNKSGVEAA